MKTRFAVLFAFLVVLALCFGHGLKARAQTATVTPATFGTECSGNPLSGTYELPDGGTIPLLCLNHHWSKNTLATTSINPDGGTIGQCLGIASDGTVGWINAPVGATGAVGATGNTGAVGATGATGATG